MIWTRNSVVVVLVLLLVFSVFSTMNAINSDAQKEMADAARHESVKSKYMANESVSKANINAKYAEESRYNIEAKWALLDTLKLQGIKADDGIRILNLFGEKQPEENSNIFSKTDSIGIEKHDNQPLYKVKLLNEQNEVISEIDSVSLVLWNW